MSAPAKRWKLHLRRALIALAIAALLGVSVFGVLLTSWTELREVPAAEAQPAIEEVLGAVAEQRAYIFITPDGDVEVRRELELPEPADLRTLHVVGWEPRHERLADVAFPMWFVRMKMSSGLDFGTLASFIAGDWENLDLSISLEDLERRGPGLILDLRRPDGARLVLWTE